MSKILLALIFAFFVFGATNAHSAIKGIPVSDDQYAHAFGSMYLTKLCKSYDLGVIETVGINLALGIAKELYDMNSTGFNTGDIGVNLCGVGLAYSVDF